MWQGGLGFFPSYLFLIFLYSNSSSKYFSLIINFYFLYWCAGWFTFSEGGRTATTFASPGLPHFIAHKLLIFHFSTTYLPHSFSAITPPLHTHFPLYPVGHWSTVFSLNFPAKARLDIDLTSPSWWPLCFWYDQQQHTDSHKQVLLGLSLLPLRKLTTEWVSVTPRAAC